MMRHRFLSRPNASSARLTACVAALSAIGWATTATAEVRVGNCATVPEAGLDLTTGQTLTISLDHDPATGAGDAQLTFALESADDDELTIQVNAGNVVELDDTDSNNTDLLRTFYIDVSRSDLTLGSNSITFAYNGGDGALLRRLCLVQRAPTAPTPRPLVETFCADNARGNNAANNNNPTGNEIDNGTFEGASIDIPSAAITDTSVVGLYATLRSNGGNEGSTRTFHLRDDDNRDGEIIVDYSGIDEDRYAILSAPVTTTDFFSDATPDLRITSSMSANVNELCITISNDGPEPSPEPDPTPEGDPDGGPDNDAGPDGGGPDDAGAEPEGGPGVTPTPDVPTPDTPTPDAPTPDVPSPDAPTPDVPNPDAPAPDTPAPDATPGVTPGPNAEPDPRPETGEPGAGGEPEEPGDNPLGQGFAVSSCASSSAPGTVPFLFGALVLLAFAFHRRRQR